jgi:hypothetical protein
MKPGSAKPVPGHHRCLYLSATDRKCRNWVLDPRAMFCPRHMQAQPSNPPAPLPQKPTPARKTLPAQQAAPRQKPALTENSLPTQKRALTNKIVPQPSTQPTPQRATEPAPSANAAPTGDYLDCGPGRPLPAIRAEFAAQVLKAVDVTPRTPTAMPPIPPKSNPADINPNAISPTAVDPAHINATGVNQSHTQVKSPIIPPAAKTTTEPTIQTTNEPVNQPTEKKRYQVRVHTNMHVTGSEPQWGWTTDP